MENLVVPYPDTTYTHLRTFSVLKDYLGNLMPEIAKLLSASGRGLPIFKEEHGEVILVNQILITHAISNGADHYAVGIQNIDHGVSPALTVTALGELYEFFRDKSVELFDDGQGPGEITIHAEVPEYESVGRGRMSAVVYNAAEYVDAMALCFRTSDYGLVAPDPRELEFPKIIFITNSFNDGPDIHILDVPKGRK